MTEKRLIYASDMAKKYDNFALMVKAFYLDVLQPKMLAVAHKQKFYTMEIGENNQGYWFHELDGNPDKVKITYAVFDLLVDLGYTCKTTPKTLPSGKPYVGCFDLTISWENQGDGLYDI